MCRYDNVIHVSFRAGIHCETNIDDCAGVTCDVTDSECVDGIDSYSCNCIAGYFGKIVGFFFFLHVVRDFSARSIRNKACSIQMLTYHSVVHVPHLRVDLLNLALGFIESLPSLISFFFVCHLTMV